MSPGHIGSTQSRPSLLLSFPKAVILKVWSPNQQPEHHLVLRSHPRPVSELRLYPALRLEHVSESPEGLFIRQIAEHLRVIRAFLWLSSSFLSLVECCSIVWTYRSVFIHLSKDISIASSFGRL